MTVAGHPFEALDAASARVVAFVQAHGWTVTVSPESSGSTLCTVCLCESHCLPDLGHALPHPSRFVQIVVLLLGFLFLRDHIRAFIADLEQKRALRAATAADRVTALEAERARVREQQQAEVRAAAAARRREQQQRAVNSANARRTSRSGGHIPTCGFMLCGSTRLKGMDGVIT